MARTYVKDFQPGMNIEDQIFHLKEKDLRTGTNGSLYLSLVLADKTGPVNARLWQATEPLYKSLPQDGFVRVKGRTENYKGVIQFIVDAIQAVGEDEQIDVEEFLPATEKDIEQMYERVLELLRSMKDKPLLFLVKQFVDDQDLMGKFKKAPAAVIMHHACIGGLLEHTLGTMELARLTASRYPQVDPDILLTGAFLHDIGKIKELEWATSLKYTDKGQLLGHLVMGAMMVEEKATSAEKDLGSPFPKRTLDVLQHMIISHHGEYEHGAAKLPMTSEAVILHYIDNLDAKMDTIKRHFDNTQADESWTNYVRSMERKFFKTTLEDPNAI